MVNSTSSRTFARNIMKKILLYILLGLAIIGEIRAQQTISGVLFDKDNEEPLGYATVQLFTQKDSTFVTGTTSADDGSFIINNVHSGSYRLSVSFVGLAGYEQKVIVKDVPLNLGKINMGTNDNTLEEVVVKGVAAQVSVKNDTLEYNAVAFKVTENAVTEDLLKKMPGIEIDDQGRIFVNGEQVKKIRINGKRFFGDNTKAATKSLPADLIDKIQIIDEQSEMAKLTGFEDGETTKMINITIREDKKKGMFANVYGAYGSDDRYEVNGIANWMHGSNISTLLGGFNNTNNSRFEGIGDIPTNIPGMRISRNQMTNGITTSEMIGGNTSLDLNPAMKLEANYSFGSPSTIIKQIAEREYYETEQTKASSTKYLDRYITSDRWANAHNIGFRFEWKIDKNSTLIIDPDFTYSTFDADNLTKSLAMRMDGDTAYTGTIKTTTSGTDYRGVVNVTYSRKLKKRGRTLSFLVRGNFTNSDTEGINNDHRINYKNNKPTTGKDNTNHQYDGDNSVNGYYLRASFVEPVTKNNRMELAFSQRYNRTIADKLSYKYNPVTSEYSDEPDPIYSSRLTSDFRTYDLNLNFKRYQKKYRLTFGVKGEYYDMNSSFPLLAQDSSRVERDGFNISPSANLIYNFNKKKYLKFDYRAYTSQPSAAQLLPARNQVSTSHYRTGNPDLSPTSVQVLKGTYSAYNKNNFSLLTVNLNGTYRDNAVISISRYEGNNQYSSYVNVNGLYNIYGNVLYNKPFFNNRLVMNTNTPFAFNNSIGYTKEDNVKNYLKNNTRVFRLGERLKFMYQNHFTELSAGAEISYVKSRNDVNERSNTDTYDWEYFGSVLFRLPYNITIDTDVTAAYKSGYADGFDQSEIIWNAEIEKLVFKNKKGIVSFKIYDILNQRISIRRSIGANYIEDSEYNTMKQYFLVCFAYKFSIGNSKKK